MAEQQFDGDWAALHEDWSHKTQRGGSMERKLKLIIILIVAILLIPGFAMAADDTTPPTIVSTYPAVEAVKIPVDISGITVTFSEPVSYDPDPGTGIELATYIEGSGEYVDYPFGEVTCSGDTLTISAPIDPDPWFENWMYYFVTVRGVKDLAGNEMVADGDDYYYYRFHTVSTDITPPYVVSTIPTNGEIGVSADVVITMTMSEPIAGCTGHVALEDDQGNPVDFVWDILSDTGHPEIIIIDPDASLAAGTYTVTIEEIEDWRENAIDAPISLSFTVGYPPVADAGPSIEAWVNEVVAFDASGSTDVDGYIVTYYWDFGDGYTSSAVAPSHSYPVSGDYTVYLEVTDNDGLTDGDTIMVIVRTPAEATHSLSDTVDSLGLPSGIETGLMDKLAAAEMLIYQGKYIPAKQTLLAFINQVNSQIGKTLTQEQADDLIAVANRILAEIS
jgi:PKD repeat protein